MTEFAERLRGREPLIGYWIVLDAPPATERLATLGFDYLCLDAQHGLIGPAGILAGVLATDAGSSVGPRPTAAIVRVESVSALHLGKALDAGAAAVIVPLVNTAEEAASAVSAAKYPPS